MPISFLSCCPCFLPSAQAFGCGLHCSAYFCPNETFLQHSHMPVCLRNISAQQLVAEALLLRNLCPAWLVGQLEVIRKLDLFQVHEPTVHESSLSSKDLVQPWLLPEHGITRNAKHASGQAEFVELPLASSLCKASAFESGHVQQFCQTPLLTGWSQNIGQQPADAP